MRIMILMMMIIMMMMRPLMMIIIDNASDGNDLTLIPMITDCKVDIEGLCFFNHIHVVLKLKLVVIYCKTL